MDRSRVKMGDKAGKRTEIIVVDMQGVFCDPDGAVYIPRCTRCVQPILQILEKAGRRASVITAARVAAMAAIPGACGYLSGVDEILIANLPSVQISTP